MLLCSMKLLEERNFPHANCCSTDPANDNFWNVAEKYKSGSHDLINMQIYVSKGNT